MPDRHAGDMTVRQLRAALEKLTDPDQLDLPVMMDGCGGCAHHVQGVDAVSEPTDAVWLTHCYSSVVRR
jgi:hypothetical protein